MQYVTGLLKTGCKHADHLICGTAKIFTTEVCLQNYKIFSLCLEKQAGSLFLRKCRSCLFHQQAGGIRKTAVISTIVQNMYL